MTRRVGRPTVAYVDVAALRANFARVRAAQPAGVAVLATVKADAYGHGASLIAPVLAVAGAELFGVATVEEGVELRRAGIVQPVLVLAGTRGDEVMRAAEHDLSVAVFDAANARDLVAGLGSENRLRVHVKLDTGMTRLGVRPAALPDLIEVLRTTAVLTIDGVFSHFASARDVSSDFAADQIRLFDRGVAELGESGLRPRWRHLANSVAAVERPGELGNVVRPGIVLYGAGPGVDPVAAGWEPVMHLCSEIWQLKSVPAGTAVGYGQTFVTQRPSRIAVLPIGYADGYPRGLSNRGEVLVRERRAPVVGSVCMDLTTVDVTDVAEVETGDEVVLWGRQGNATMFVNEVAERQGTISYELLTGVGKRVPRVPLDSGATRGH